VADEFLPPGGPPSRPPSLPPWISPSTVHRIGDSAHRERANGDSRRVPGESFRPGTLQSVPISSRILDDDEEVLVDMRLHWVFLSGPLAATAVAIAAAAFLAAHFSSAPVAVAWVLAAMVAVPAAWAVGRIVRWFGISLVVTTSRIVYRRGVLGRQMVQLRLQRVTEIHSKQTLLDRIVGCGEIVIEIAGEEPMTVHDVRRPRALQRVINLQLDGFGSTTTAENGRPTGVPMRPIAVPGPMEIHDTPPQGLTVIQPMTPAGPPPAAPPPATGPPPAAALPSATGQSPAWSIPDQLIQLDDLRQRGIISEGEFAAKKTELLRRL